VRAGQLLFEDRSGLLPRATHLDLARASARRPSEFCRTVCCETDHRRLAIAQRWQACRSQGHVEFARLKDRIDLEQQLPRAHLRAFRVFAPHSTPDTRAVTFAL